MFLEMQYSQFLRKWFTTTFTKTHYWVYSEQLQSKGTSSQVVIITTPNYLLFKIVYTYFGGLACVRTELDTT